MLSAAKIIVLCMVVVLAGCNGAALAACSVSAQLPLLDRWASAPSIMQTSDGRVIFQAKTATGRGPDRISEIFTHVKSEDSDSWIARSPLVQRRIGGGLRKVNLGNVNTIELSNRWLLSAYRDHEFLRGRDQWRHRLKVSISRNGGKSWEEQGVIAQVDHLTQGIWEPFLILPRSDHRFVDVYYAEERPMDLTCSGVYRRDAQDIVRKTSSDFGRTWSKPLTVLRRGRDRVGVPTIAKLIDGSYLMAFETLRNPQCGSRRSELLVGFAKSKDKGKSWSFLPSFRELKRPGEVTSWPSLATLPGGKLILKYSTNRNYLERGMLPRERRVKMDIEFVVSENRPTYETLAIWPTKSALAITGRRWGQVSVGRKHTYITGAGKRGAIPMMVRLNTSGCEG